MTARELMSSMFADAGIEPEEARRTARRGLTGRMVLAIVLCFFATVGTVNAVMIRFALTSFRGEVVDHPYEAGLVFNSEIAAARAQEARHWKVEAQIDNATTPRALRVAARDQEGHPLTGLRIKADFVAPVNNRLDRHVLLEERQDGSYEGALPVSGGIWDLDIIAARAGETVFRSRSRIHLD